MMVIDECVDNMLYVACTLEKGDGDDIPSFVVDVC